MTKSNSFPAWLDHAKTIVCTFEGCSLKAYPDPGTGGDPWTIGWGHTGPDVKPGLEIGQTIADGYLIIDLKAAASGLFDLLPEAANFAPEQQAALISFIFNVGRGAFADSTLLRRLLKGDDPIAVVTTELPRWNKAGAKVLPGLTRRRNAEVDLFKKGLNKPAPVKIPTGSSEPVWPAGMVGPKRRPNLKPGDHHLIANDVAETITAYTHDGKRLWQVPCLCRGQGKEAEWSRTGEDTPPGLYLAGKVYRDYEEDPSETFSEERRAYGWYAIDLIGQEGQEGPDSKPYRDGIMIHGGGTACGFPGAWKPRQPLHPTLGCIRMHNADLRDRLLPLLALGRVWVSVLQEAK